MIFACSYSLLPRIVTPSAARETIPEIRQQVADAQRVGPPAWRRLRNVGAGNSFDLHRRVLKIKREVLPFPVVLYFYIRESPTDRFKSQSALLTKNVVKLPYEFAVSSAPFLCRKEMNPPDVFPTEIPVYVLARGEEKLSGVQLLALLRE